MTKNTETNPTHTTSELANEVVGFAIHHKVCPLELVQKLRAQVERDAERTASLLAALDRCLPFVDRCRLLSGGDGDLASLLARSVLIEAKGGAQ